jgi:hypothetical protein
MSLVRLSRLALLLAVACLAGAARAGDEAAPEPAAAPERLSDTGLYMDIASGAVDPWNLPFEPQYPLWTDGAAKSRWIRIPDGTTIDAHDTEVWKFPVGTKFWKEFSFGGTKVETRMIWRAAEDQWVFAAYVWNEDQSEAVLAPQEGLRRYKVIAPGVSHSIPSRADCGSCHESGPSPILGFSALQLSDDRDRLAPHAQPLKPGMVTLRTLDTFRLLSPRRRDLLDDPPRIHAESPVARAALGYLSANCGHCHNGRGRLATLGMSLTHASRARLDGTEPSISTIVGVPGTYAVPGAPESESRRIAKRLPESSAIVYRMSSRKPSSQMPPLGTAMVDTEAVELIKRWIREDLH